MTSEQVLEVLVRRHVFDSERPFSSVLEGIFGGISQLDIGLLFRKLAASTVASAIAPYGDAAACTGRAAARSRPATSPWSPAPTR